MFNFELEETKNSFNFIQFLHKWEIDIDFAKTVMNKFNLNKDTPVTFLLVIIEGH